MEKEKQLLILCRQLIEQSLNWGDSVTWGNDDFEQLSEKIFEKTKVQLSVSTLKRIWGKVRYENFPTSGTLNALSSFLGYEGWRDFRQKNQTDEPVTTATPQPQPVNEAPGPAAVIEDDSSQKNTENRIPYLQISGFVILVVCVFLIVRSLYLEKVRLDSIDLSKIKFEATKVTDNLPNSVIFNYDAAIFKSDSVFIQQSWDPRRRERVDGNAKQHTSVYYEPGFFIAKLIVDGNVKKECPVFIKSKGWLGTIESRPVPIYLSEKEIKGNHFMGISDSLLKQKIGTPVFNGVTVKFANVREFKDIDAGNFVLETTLRNSSAVEASVCRIVNVLLLGTGKAMIIPLADKGCVSQLDLLTGEVWISGKDHDMSAFGCDFSQFQTLKCTVEKQMMKVYLNNKLIFHIQQKQTLGEIVGIRYEFEGAGQVRDVTLSTPGKGNYHDAF